MILFHLGVLHVTSKLSLITVSENIVYFKFQHILHY